MSMLAYRDIWEKTAVLKPQVKQTRKGCMKWKTTENHNFELLLYVPMR